MNSAVVRHDEYISLATLRQVADDFPAPSVKLRHLTRLACNGIPIHRPVPQAEASTSMRMQLQGLLLHDPSLIQASGKEAGEDEVLRRFLLSQIVGEAVRLWIPDSLKCAPEDLHETLLVALARL